jgi:toxin ParE1/3/4
MKKAITKGPQAYRDLVEIADHIARDSIDASDRFLEAAETTFDRLAETPEIGSLCPFKNPLAADIRVWPVRRFKRYLVFYRPELKCIYVVRVLHGARDWQSLFEEYIEE